MTRRLQNKISESVLTLYVVAAFTLVAWTLRGWTLSSGIALAVVVVVAYLLMEMDAIGGLLRIRSRMIPSVWLMLAIAFTAFHAFCYLFSVSLSPSISCSAQRASASLWVTPSVRPSISRSGRSHGRLCCFCCRCCCGVRLSFSGL